MQDMCSHKYLPYTYLGRHCTQERHCCMYQLLPQPRTLEPRLLAKVSTFSPKVTVHKLIFLCTKEDSKWQVRLLTLKGVGFLVSQICGGGADSARIEKTQYNSSQCLFRVTNRVSYESLGLQLKFDTLLRSLRLKLRPRKVAEVARVQAKKNSIKNSKIRNF